MNGQGEAMRMAIAAAAMLLCQSAAAAASLETAIANCAAKPDEKARLACYDALAAQVKPAAAAAAAPAAPPTPATKSADFGADSLPSQKRESEDQEEPDEIKVALKDFSYTTSGHFLLTLANGQVWQQASADRQRFRGKVGDTITVTHGFLTSYNLTVEGHTGLYKVIRVH